MLTSFLDADLQVAVKPNGGVRDELEDRHLEARCCLNLRVINCRTDAFRSKYVSMQQRGRVALLPDNIIQSSTKTYSDSVSRDLHSLCSSELVFAAVVEEFKLPFGCGLGVHPTELD